MIVEHRPARQRDQSSTDEIACCRRGLSKFSQAGNAESEAIWRAVKRCLRVWPGGDVPGRYERYSVGGRRSGAKI